MFVSLLALLFADLVQFCGAEDVRTTMPLNRVVMIQPHDAATGELNPERDKIVARWARTQNNTILEQLDCGARAFDYRPYLADDNVLYAHHGPIVIFKPLEETIQELQDWGAKNPTELIVISMSHCVTQRFENNYYAEACRETALQLLNKYNVHTITNCSEFQDLTYGDALSYGTVLVEFGCSFGFWDPSLTCYGKEDGVQYACYETSRQPNTSYIPWGHLTSFLSTNTEVMPVSNGVLWSIGGNWQSSAQSVVLGTLHNSSLLLDEKRSGINAWLPGAIRSGLMKNLNMLGVDNVCDGGAEIAEAINEYYY